MNRAACMTVLKSRAHKCFTRKMHVLRGDAGLGNPRGVAGSCFLFRPLRVGIPRERKTAASRSSPSPLAVFCSAESPRETPPKDPARRHQPFFPPPPPLPPRGADPQVRPLCSALGKERSGERAEAASRRPALRTMFIKSHEGGDSRQQLLRRR